MKTKSAFGGFFFGLAAGVVFGLTLALLLILLPDAGGSDLSASLAITKLEIGLDWAYHNLGLSLPVFALVLGLFGYSLNDLRKRIADDGPIDEVAQADHLIDTWTSLFFGVGVIWTAIGMRGALLFALGDPENTAADGAFAVLQRMVNGGILVALSTTILGGIGGYLMRVIKTVTVGASLKRYYDRASQQAGDEIQSTLNAMELHLAQLADATTPEETHHARAALE